MPLVKCQGLTPKKCFIMKSNKLLILFPLFLTILILFLSIITMSGLKQGIKDRFQSLVDIRNRLETKYNIALTFDTIQNTMHFPFYAALAFFWMRFFHKRGRALNKAVLFTLAIMLSFSIITELIQYFLPARDASLGDLKIDFFGSIFGIFIYFLRDTRYAIRNTTTNS